MTLHWEDPNLQWVHVTFSNRRVSYVRARDLRVRSFKFCWPFDVFYQLCLASDLATGPLVLQQVFLDLGCAFSRFQYRFVLLPLLFLAAGLLANPGWLRTLGWFIIRLCPIILQITMTIVQRIFVFVFLLLFPLHHPGHHRSSRSHPGFLPQLGRDWYQTYIRSVRSSRW